MFFPSFQIIRRGKTCPKFISSSVISLPERLGKSTLLGTIFPDSKSFYIQQYYDSATRPHVCNLQVTSSKYLTKQQNDTYLHGLTSSPTVFMVFLIIRLCSVKLKSLKFCFELRVFVGRYQSIEFSNSLLPKGVPKCSKVSPKKLP